MRTMGDRIERFLKKLGEVVGRCVVEDLEALEPAILILLCIAVVFCICCLGIVIHDFIFDPDSADVAARLTQLSIDPDKWKFLS
jgi:hypothetical protein